LLSLPLPLAEVDSEPPNSHSDGSTKTFTIALHSRHRYSSIDGCNIQFELDCLDQMMTHLLVSRRSSAVAANTRLSPASPQTRFEVSIMSDRACTISRVSEQLPALNITVLVAAHDKGKSGKDEHGPFAGVGFFHDWALVSSHARSGFIGTFRSSSKLVLELIEFNRKLEIWKNSGMNNVTDIEVCFLGKGRGADKRFVL